MSGLLPGPCMRLGLVALLACTACLPDTLSDAEVAAKVATAEGQKVFCGNGNVDPGEQCDDENDDDCDACANCQRRRVLDVVSAESLAAVLQVNPPLLEGNKPFAAETWFFLRKPPGPAETQFFFGYGKASGPSLTAAFFAMGVGRPDDKTTTTLPVCVLSRGSVAAVLAYGKDPVLANTWHHLRCAYLPAEKKVRMWVDGKDAGSSNALLNPPGKLFAAESVLTLGAIPTEKGKPFEGLLDELRIVTGDEAANAKGTKFRYDGNEPGTELLLHMDVADGDKQLADAGPRKLDAPQVSFSGGLVVAGGKALSHQPGACYGYAEADLTCGGKPVTPPAWCAAK